MSIEARRDAPDEWKQPEKKDEKENVSSQVRAMRDRIARLATGSERMEEKFDRQAKNLGSAMRDVALGQSLFRVAELITKEAEQSPAQANVIFGDLDELAGIMEDLFTISKESIDVHNLINANVAAGLDQASARARLRDTEAKFDQARSDAERLLVRLADDYPSVKEEVGSQFTIMD